MNRDSLENEGCLGGNVRDIIDLRVLESGAEEYDSLIADIESGVVNPNNISYDVIREKYKKGIITREEMNYGRRVLQNTDHLDSYLWTYGKIVRQQWKVFLEEYAHSFVIGREGINVIDYGCGQGLASALFLDAVPREMREQFRYFQLVEPSSVALRRATAVVGCYCPKARITPTQSGLNELALGSEITAHDRSTIHLFSNVLDIVGIDSIGVLNKIVTTPGTHAIFAISHDRDFDGGAAPLREICERVRELGNDGELKIVINSVEPLDLDGRKFLALNSQFEVF